ncbi:PIN domain-containing protein [Crocosphaera chwakensis]|uniref:Predicted nucleic acid-binding protein, containing PIN domain n=1 Tax=Crocosphaera chwakensis CCY0110 TaxID=391612 RepID=A3ISD7_9CHRO|nr:PIN domain-containing protein [Crocosphaera chwakensis]EAZ90653.1 predicted nucleic acid-binding protein, containing PIN domain [Crocosphaera chwakensis CCY0110]
MSKYQSIIIDSNIFFSALLSKNNKFSRIIVFRDYNFFANEQLLVEIFKYKEKILNRSKLSEHDLIKAYEILIKRINLYKEELISSENRQTAYCLCKDVDENDTPHVALTLELNGLLWTGDKKLKQGLIHKGFTKFFTVD